MLACILSFYKTNLSYVGYSLKVLRDHVSFILSICHEATVNRNQFSGSKSVGFR